MEEQQQESKKELHLCDMCKKQLFEELSKEFVPKGICSIFKKLFKK